MRAFFVFLLAISIYTANSTDLESAHREQNASPRIIRGTPAASGQFPYFVHLELRFIITVLGNCGGTIIRKKWILTAAQCTSEDILGIQFKYTEIRVRAGSVVRGESQQTKIVYPNNIHIHPDYNPDTLMNDIALLQTDSPFEDTSTVSTLALITPTLNPTYYVSRFLTVSGFGYITNAGPESNVLLYTSRVVGISFRHCQAQFRTIIPTSSFCMQGAISPFTASCIGDTGGPVTIPFSGRQLRLIGIVSYTSDNGCDTAPQGATNVQQFVSWINEVVTSNEDDEIDD